MSIPYERIVEEDLNLGYGSVSVTMPGGGSATGSKIGVHTFTGAINVLDFGAVGDGVADDAPGIMAAAAAAGANGVVICPPGNYRLGSGLSILHDDQTWLLYGAVFYVDFVGVGLTLGSDTVNVKRVTVNDGTIRRMGGLDWTSGGVGLKLLKANNCHCRGQYIAQFHKGIEITTPAVANAWETTQNKIEFKNIADCLLPIYCYANEGGAVSENIFIGGEMLYASTCPSAAGAYGITIDCHASALGNVNGIKFLGTYLGTAQSGADRALAIYLNAVGCQFMNMHIEGFPSPMVMWGSDALVGGIPNHFIGGGADFLAAENDLQVNVVGRGILAAVNYTGRDGAFLACGLEDNSTYVQCFKQLGAATKQTLIVQDKDSVTNFGVDGNGGIRARAASVPNHKMFSPKDSGVGTDAYASVKSGGIETLTDDHVATILTGVNSQGMTLHVTLWSEANGTWASAVIACSTHVTQHGGTVISQGGSFFFDTLTTTVTGTDGIDGFFTVAFLDGAIMVENRTGASVRILYWLLY